MNEKDPRLELEELRRKPEPMDASDEIRMADLTQDVAELEEAQAIPFEPTAEFRQLGNPADGLLDSPRKPEGWDESTSMDIETDIEEDLFEL